MGSVTVMGVLRRQSPLLLMLAIVAFPLLLVAAIRVISHRLDAQSVIVHADPIVEVEDAGGEGLDESFTVTYPKQWLPSNGRECSDYRGRTMCNGPRKVAQPWGMAAELAEELGLGTPESVLRLMRYGPSKEWVEMVDGEPVDAFSWAVDGGKLWRGFGFVRREQKGVPHNGIDIGAPAGSHILAVADGLVAHSNNTQPGYGNMMLIIHADAGLSLYAHCLANYAFPGQKVSRGDVIGEVGATGIARGAHLHFELRVKGVPRDPLPRFRKGLVEYPLDEPPVDVDASPHGAYAADGGGLSPDANGLEENDAGL